MQANGYPKLDHHEQQHKYFESQISEFENEYAGGTGRIAASVFAFLRDWFLEHILEQDKKYVPYVE
jgi:hemerythrin-like metal-binding protein